MDNSEEKKENVTIDSNPYFKVIDEPKEEVPEKKKLIITVIVATFVLLVFFYILINVFILPDTKTLNKKSTSGLDSTTLTTLVSYVPIISNSISYPGAYRSQITTTKEVANVVLLNMGLQELKTLNTDIVEPDDAAYTTFKTNYCTDGNYNCYAFYSTSMSNAIKTLYGDDATITDADFVIGASDTNSCTYNGSLYMCKETKTQSPIIIGKDSAIVSAKQDNDNIYVYEKALFIVGAITTINDGKYNVSIDKIYKENTTDNLIASNVSITSSEENYASALIDKYSDGVQMYKHTFKKNTNGNYYWYSTEPVSGVN